MKHHLPFLTELFVPGVEQAEEGVHCDHGYGPAVEEEEGRLWLDEGRGVPQPLLQSCGCPYPSLRCSLGSLQPTAGLVADEDQAGDEHRLRLDYGPH